MGTYFSIGHEANVIMLSPLYLKPLTRAVKKGLMSHEEKFHTVPHLKALISIFEASSASSPIAETILGKINKMHYI